MIERRRTVNEPVRGGLGTYVGKVLELVELQIQLVRTNSGRASEHFKLAAGLLAISGIALLVVGTVMLLAVATLVAERTALSAGESQLVVSFVALVAVVLTGYFGIRKLLASQRAFDGTATEIARNYRAVRDSLSGSERSRYHDTLA